MTDTASAALLRLESYLKHKPRCARYGNGGAVDRPCSCGLAEALADMLASLPAPAAPEERDAKFAAQRSERKSA